MITALATKDSAMEA
jgi:hypothetical protein